MRLNKKLIAVKNDILVEKKYFTNFSESIAIAIAARDEVGTGHLLRTQILAVGIGKELNLHINEIYALRTGALLKDIGKLAVPDHILNKPGRLTPAEMDKTKIHVSVGASILENVNFPYPVVPTVKYHHEAWDGSGYPDGLKGENIPLTARILAVADAFDTLRGDRPYRAAISSDEARRFLINGSGTQFDQNIVDIFLRNLQKMEAEIDAQGLSYNCDKDNSISQMPVLFDEHSNQSYVEQIKRANREVYTLYELARVFGSSLNLQETLSLFVKKIGELVPFDTCIVYLMDETEEFAKTAYIEGENKNALKDKTVKPGEGATGYALKKRQSVHNIKPGLDFAFSEFDISQPYSAMASLPLIADEKVIGAVSLYSCEMENYEEHMRLLETVSRMAADALMMTLQHAESESRALTDPMTSLPNTRSLHMQFEKEKARTVRNGNPFFVLGLDLDGFKAVNDNFGHHIGDEMLKEVAKIMRAQLRDYDFLARNGGDEFVVIIPEIDKDMVHALCQNLEKAVTNFKLPITPNKYAQVGVSIGIASYPENGESIEQVLKAADKEMYATKAINKSKRTVSNTEKMIEK